MLLDLLILLMIGKPKVKMKEDSQGIRCFGMYEDEDQIWSRWKRPNQSIEGKIQVDRESTRGPRNQARMRLQEEEKYKHKVKMRALQRLEYVLVHVYFACITIPRDLETFEAREYGKGAPKRRMATIRPREGYIKNIESIRSRMMIC